MDVIYRDFEQPLCEEVIQVVACTKKTANLVEDRELKASVVAMCKEVVDNFKAFNGFMQANGKKNKKNSTVNNEIINLYIFKKKLFNLKR